MPVLTRKSQVTIPKNIRDRMGIRPGDTVVFEVKKNNLIVRKSFSENVTRKYIGLLGKKRTKDIMEELR